MRAGSAEINHGYESNQHRALGTRSGWTQVLKTVVAGFLCAFAVVMVNLSSSARGAITGPPAVTQLSASYADQDSAVLQAQISPGGLSAAYHFEWGPTEAYGHRIPADFNLFAGSGEEALQAEARIEGLSSGSLYHYRVVALNQAGSTASPDQIVETLNSCDLPEGRCMELVSPPDVGPVSLPGEFTSQLEPHYQAADRSGALAYITESGAPNSRKGAETLSKALRGADAWASSPISPPITALNESDDSSSGSSKIVFLDKELSCDVLASNMPLTNEPGMRQVVEVGGGNLYRQNPDSSYTGITTLTPLNPRGNAQPGEPQGALSTYIVEGVSRNCAKVVFVAPYEYAGVQVQEVNPNATKNFLYEWFDGMLHCVSYVPTGQGEVPVLATSAGALNPYANNSVSADGSRVFFTAQRRTNANPSEFLAEALFVRENGIRTRDISLSETSTPDEGARFQFASPDGEHAFFLANAGLTQMSSSEGQDLYEYDFAADKLVDLSPVEGGEADVIGFIGGSETGGHVYFAARGQLVQGEGKSLSENEADGSLSIYSEENGEVAYVGEYDEEGSIPVVTSAFQTSEVSPDGRYLLFESSANITGYPSAEGVRQGYLYDSFSTSEKIVCVTCRQDGAPSDSPTGFLDHGRFLNAYLGANTFFTPRSLALRNGAPLVFFNSADPLAPGAVEGVNNIYEWAHGQIFRIATEPIGLRPTVAPSDGPFPEFTRFISSNEDATDLYLRTSQKLTWEDGDQRISVYDARIGGGRDEPSSPPVTCNSAVEEGCQHSEAASPGAPTSATEKLRGPGNRTPKKRGRHKRHHKGHHKRHHKRHVHHKRHGRHHSGRHGHEKRRNQQKSPAASHSRSENKERGR